VIAADSLYKGFRFPEEIISHAVWLYYRFLLSLRDVQELLLERGIVVSHETIRAWCERLTWRFKTNFSTRVPRTTRISIISIVLSEWQLALGIRWDGLRHS
jgi:putative transposase